MAVESTTYISGLDATKPNGSSPKSEGDDNLRLLKTVLLYSFPGFPGSVLVAGQEAQGATQNEFVFTTLTTNQPEYSPNMFIMFRATHANTGAATLRFGALEAKALVYSDGSPLMANAITNGNYVLATYDGTSFRLMGGGNSRAVYDYIEQVQFESALPGMASQGGKFLSTDGTNALWKAGLPVYGATPTANEGPICRTGIGLMEWQGAAYAQVYTKTSIGLGNVDNTSDAAKPISTATQTALNAKASLAGAGFSGPVTAPSFGATGNMAAAGSVSAGSATLATNGDIIGPAWGGNLSTLLSASFAGKQPVGNYAVSRDGHVYGFAWSGSTPSINIDNAVQQTLWTSGNFNPATKKDAGNYTQDRSGSERVGFSWNGSALVLWVDGVGRGTITFTPF